MIQEKVVKIQGNYRDPGLMERVSANFRKFWVDIKWMNVNCDGNNNCILYLSLYDRYNLGNVDLSILTLSKMVDIDYVEIINDYNVKNFELNYNNSERYEWGEKVEQSAWQGIYRE